MDRSRKSTSTKLFAAGMGIPRLKRTIIPCLLGLLATIAASAQTADTQDKFSAVKQSVAENKQKLLQYQWTETTQLTLKGDPKPVTQNLCRYGPDGQVQKTPRHRRAAAGSSKKSSQRKKRK